MSGTATLINYSESSAWEYNAYAYRALTTGPQGGPTDGTSGQLLMNGVEYDTNYDLLVLDFFAQDSTPFITGEDQGDVETDLTLLLVKLDLRQDNNGPPTTKAKFDIWNSNEVRFSGTERCITCWDQTLLENYDAPNHFFIENLQTDKGKARINGMASTVCPLSQDSPLLGVETKIIDFEDGIERTEVAGSTMVGQGEDATGFIRYDLIDAPEEQGSGANNGTISNGSLLVKPVKK